MLAPFLNDLARFESTKVFQELESRGYDYRSFNTSGECTPHYNVKDIATNLNMGEWVPQWCFWFINWALERTNGSCSMKLDWFAGKQIHASAPAIAVSGLSVSDHDPVVVAFSLRYVQLRS